MTLTWIGGGRPPESGSIHAEIARHFMQSLLQWLAANPYILLFLVVSGAVLLAKVTVKGCGLDLPGAAIVVGASTSALASALDVRLGIDSLPRSIFYALFVYGLGLRIGPSFVHALKGDGLKFTALAVLCSTLGLGLAMAFVTMWDLPDGAAGGILAGSMTLPAAIGSAEEAVRQGALPLAEGQNPDDVNRMIALSYALTCLWGGIGIVILGKYLPRWWDVDAKAEARKHEENLGVPNVDQAGLTGLRPLPVRAFRLTNDTLSGWTVRQFHLKYPRHKVLNVLRNEPVHREPLPEVETGPSLEEHSLALAAAGVHSTTRLREPDTTIPAQAKRERGMLPEASYANLGAADDLALRSGDIVTICGPSEEMARNIALIGPEVADPAALNVPVDHAEILVTTRALEDRDLGELRNANFAGLVSLHHVERGGVPIPFGLHTRLQRGDMLFVAGVKSALDRLANVAGHIVRENTSADLVLISAGLVLGLLIGAVSLPLGGANVGLGSAGGLLAAGVIVSSAVSRLRFSGRVRASRNLLEELALAIFVAIVGIDAGASLATQVSGDLAGRILIAGFVTSTLPPVVAWAVGYHVLKINPAVLMGGIAGARSHGGAARAAAGEIGSSVPWIGFPAGYAVSTVVLTAFGYLAMVLSR